MLSLPHMQKRQNGLPWTGTSHTRIWTLFLFPTELGRWLYLLATFFSMIALKSWRNQSLQLLYHQHQPSKVCEGCLFAAGANPRRSLLSLWAQWRADKRFALFVILLLSLWWFLSRLDLRKHCFSSEKWQSDCDRWNLTLLLKDRNEDVQTHSFLLSGCRFPKRRLQQHMAVLHSHFSFTYLDFQPLSPHQSFPIHCLPSSLPISSVCAGNDLCCCKKK